jgi:hypothetical protein
MLAVLLLAGELFTQGLAPLDTGAASGQLSAAACSACHAAAHGEWSRSRHGLAWTNAIFQREYQQRPLEWCVHCHAPLREQLAEVRRARDLHVERAPAAAGAGGAATPAARFPPVADTPLASEGVTCAVCHVRGGRIVAAHRRDRSPHDTDVRAEFGGPAFCGGCHQFNFPIMDEGAGLQAVVGYSRHPMQDTVRQHARGPRAATPCRQCHADSPGRHAYPGGHDPAMLARAVSLDGCRDRGPRGGTLRLTISNTGAGHNVPTGDLHRHLVLRVWRPGAPERLHETLFGRRFKPAPDGGKRTVADTTLAAGATRVVHVPVATLGPSRPRDGTGDDTIRVELRLVYTIDEFPFRGRELAEPTYAQVAARELSWPTLGRCVPLAHARHTAAPAAVSATLERTAIE